MNPDRYPIIDLHCDLLAYLTKVPEAWLLSSSEIGASVPYLRGGNVKLQVMAIFTLTEPGSTQWATSQAKEFQSCLDAPYFLSARTPEEVETVLTSDRIGIVAAIENASGFCEEDDSLESGFANLERLIETTGRILYISFTHHLENRFGGGNYSENVGLKSDGEALLEYLDGRNICVDLSHSSDALAEGIFTYVDTQKLDIPIIASHSNFRPKCNHVRNLPDELAQEVIRRKGLIGINFLRAYIDNERPEMLFEHVQYGLDLGAEDVLGFGADFFYIYDFPDPDRYPLFFVQHENASKYPKVLQGFAQAGIGSTMLPKISHRNVVDFLKRIW